MIAVVEHGRVVELGSHEELLALDGTYARMFRLQASRFTDA
jgi:ATP-binding cassette subfamily B protein